MKIDFDKQLVNFEGEPLKNEQEKPVTLRSICANALLANEVDSSGRPKEVSGEDKLKRYNLANKIHGSTAPVEIKSEDIVEIKRMLAANYSTLIVGQVFKILEGK